jgi:tetratricopeptide (TPR) repeat protein
MPEQTLDRLIRIGLKAVVVGIAVAAVVYFVERRDTSPSLVDRQISAAEAAVREQPAETGLRLRLADMYRAAKRPADALDQYEAVLKVEAGQSTALLGRGEVLAETGDPAEASRSFEEIIRRATDEQYAGVDPQLEAAYYGLGSAMLKRGKAKDARRAVEKAVEIEPTDADAWYLLGVAALKAGAYERAVKALREAVLFVPTEWCQPYEALSKAYAAQHRKPQAEYATAMVELCSGDPAAATRRLRHLTSGPIAVDAMLGLGMAAEKESHRASAARWYRKVAAADPENFNAQSGLTRLGAATGGE